MTFADSTLNRCRRYLRFDRTIKPNRIEGNVSVDKLRQPVNPGGVGPDHAPRNWRVQVRARLDMIRFAGDAFQSEDHGAIGWLDGSDAWADANCGDRETPGVTQRRLAAVRHSHRHNVRARLLRNRRRPGDNAGRRI